MLANHWDFLLIHLVVLVTIGVVVVVVAVVIVVTGETVLFLLLIFHCYSYISNPFIM